MQRLLGHFDYNNQPAGVLQANSFEGYTTRPVSEALPSVDVSQFNVALVFGTGSGTAGATAGAEWSTAITKLTREMKNVSDIYLNEIQYKTVQNVSSGDGFCRFRLKMQDVEILESNCSGNTSGTVDNGFIVLLDSATGVVRFDTPRLIKHYKNRDGTFNANANIQLGVLDETGAGRGYQKMVLNMTFVTKYYQ